LCFIAGLGRLSMLTRTVIGWGTRLYVGGIISYCCMHKHSGLGLGTWLGQDPCKFTPAAQVASSLLQVSVSINKTQAYFIGHLVTKTNNG
jgi:hypothetical protein